VILSRAHAYLHKEDLTAADSLPHSPKHLATVLGLDELIETVMYIFVAQVHRVHQTIATPRVVAVVAFTAAGKWCHSRCTGKKNRRRFPYQRTDGLDPKRVRHRRHSYRSSDRPRNTKANSENETTRREDMLVSRHGSLLFNSTTFALLIQCILGTQRHTSCSSARASSTIWTVKLSVNRIVR
jgi:hypothetical protein